MFSKQGCYFLSLLAHDPGGVEHLRMTDEFFVFYYLTVRFQIYLSNKLLLISCSLDFRLLLIWWYISLRDRPSSSFLHHKLFHFIWNVFGYFYWIRFRSAAYWSKLITPVIYNSVVWYCVFSSIIGWNQSQITLELQSQAISSFSVPVL